jgi:hypothetical protein
MKNNTKKWQDADKTEMHQILDYHCKGVVIDIAACEQYYSLFGGESAFDYTLEIEISFSDYTPEIKICFEKSSFHLSNGDPNVEQHIVTHNLIAWNERTMKEDLVNFETRFKHRLLLEDKDSVPEDWKQSKLQFMGSKWQGTTSIKDLLMFLSALTVTALRSRLLS